MWFKHNAALVFWILHTVGLAGYHFAPEIFKFLTPFHLLGITFLLFWKGIENWDVKTVIALVLLWGIGFSAEAVGVSTGMIFGEYSYGTSLGLQWLNVPITIGINWMSLVFCAYSIFNIENIPIWMRSIFAGITITIFDYFLEPVAISYGWWEWVGIEVPTQNYIAWFLLVFLLSLGLNYFKVKSVPKSLAINFVIAQGIFFVLLNYITNQ